MQEIALRRCLVHIEEKVGWGDAAGWTSREFEDLSLRIQEETSGVVSATTLKRVWGRVAYHSNPSRHTLDTLAVFIGYDTWRAWVNAVVQAEIEGTDAARDNSEAADGEARDDHETTSSPERPTAVGTAAGARTRRAWRLPARLRFLGLSVGVFAIALALWAGLNLAQQPSVADGHPNVHFASRAVSDGLPNTVIFEYDVRGVEADSFFIQQSWDASRRVPVSPQQRILAATYYEPGFYNASLVADDRVLKEHPVHVTTDGWLALVEGAPSPTYLPEANVPGRGYLTVPREMLEERNLTSANDPPIVSFYNVRPFESLHTDDFTFETILRHAGTSSTDPCKRAEVGVIGEHGALVLLLGIPGCVGELKAMFGDSYVDGTTNDLSALGIDLADWQRVVMQVRDRNVRVQVGDNQPLTARYSMDVGRLVGLQFRSAGSAAIDEVRLADGEGRVVYEDSF